MMQTKEEYSKVRDIIAPRRCGKYRYMPRAKRIRKMNKWLNQNRADARLSSFVHNFCRFTSVKINTNIDAREAREGARKLAYFEKRAKFALLRYGIHIFKADIEISASEEKEISEMLARINSHSFNTENSQSAKSKASVRFKGKNE